MTSVLRLDSTEPPTTGPGDKDAGPEFDTPREASDESPDTGRVMGWMDGPEFDTPREASDVSPDTGMVMGWMDGPEFDPPREASDKSPDTGMVMGWMDGWPRIRHS